MSFLNGSPFGDGNSGSGGGGGTIDPALINHNLLNSLTVGDVHTQYLFLLGRAGGQTVIGGINASDNLLLQSTSHATKGLVQFGSSTGATFNETVGSFMVGTDSSTIMLEGVPDIILLGAISQNDSSACFCGLKYTSDTDSPVVGGGKARGTEAVPLIIQDGDDLVVFGAIGYDGAGFRLGGAFIYSVDGTPGIADMPTSATFTTRAVGAAFPAPVFQGTNTQDLMLFKNLTFTGTDSAGLTARQLTTVQRDALTGVDGNIIYNLTDSVGQIYQNGVWEDLGGTVDPSTINHNLLMNLSTGDVHTQYLLLAGRVGGQHIADDLTFAISTKAGLAVNNLTTVQRDALTAVNGNIIYNLTDSIGQIYQNGVWDNLASAVNPATIDHNLLMNLTTGDVHTQYLLLAGRVGGQDLNGDYKFNGIVTYISSTVGINHTDLMSIGTNTHVQIDSHIANIANPHSVTAAQVGNTVAQWNSNQIQSINVLSTAPTDGQVLQYVAANLQYEATTPVTGVEATPLTLGTMYGYTENLGTNASNTGLGYNVSDTSTGNNSVYIGYSAGPTSTSRCVGIGSDALAGNTNIDWTTAVGFNCTAATGEAVVIGALASIGTNSTQAIAIGEEANVRSNAGNSVCIGDAADVNLGDQSSIALGSFTQTGGANEFAIGRQATGGTIQGEILRMSAPNLDGHTSATAITFNTVTGEINFQTSSLRYKENVRPINEMVTTEQILKLEPKCFDYKHRSRLSYTQEELDSDTETHNVYYIKSCDKEELRCKKLDTHPTKVG